PARRRAVCPQHLVEHGLASDANEPREAGRDDSGEGPMPPTLTGCFWQESQCGEMIAAATRSARVPFTASSFPSSGPEACCRALGLECERIAVLGETIIPALRRLAPGVLSIPGQGYLLLVGWRGSSARMLTPSRKTKRVPIEALCDLMLEQTEEAVRAEIDRLLESAGVP